MPIIHIEKRDRWSSISNATLEDANLSFKARGLLAYLLSKPDTWTANITELGHASVHDGEKSIRAALAELVEYGYASFRRSRINGRFVEGGWIIRELPPSVFPHAENGDMNQNEPSAGFPHVENPHAVFPHAENGDVSKDLEEVTTEDSKNLEEITPSVSTIVETSPPRQKKSQRLRTDYAPGFLAWWNLYPSDRRISKPECLMVWLAHGLEARTQELCEKLERLLATTWKDCEHRYIKTSLPYLNSGRYEDDLVPLPEIPTQQASGLSEKAYRSAMASMKIMEDMRHDDIRRSAKLLSKPEQHD